MGQWTPSNVKELWNQTLFATAIHSKPFKVCADEIPLQRVLGSNLKGNSSEPIVEGEHWLCRVLKYALYYVLQTYY